MGREYFKMWHSYLDSIAPLNDAERGRLFTALLEYSKTGTTDKITGNERFIFPTLKANVDRDADQYSEISKRNAENGSKGGRPKKPNESEKTQPVFEKPKETEKSQDKDKDKDKDNKRTPSNEGVRKDTALAAVMDDFLNRVNPDASQRCLEELAAYVETLGEAVCKRAFDIALDEKKPTWSYIRAILRDKQAKGIKSFADWDAAEQSREKKPGKPPKSMQPGTDTNPTKERIKANADWLDEFLASQEAGSE